MSKGAFKGKKTRKIIVSKSHTQVTIRNQDGSFRKTEARVTRENFYGSYKHPGVDPEYLIIGFDTEFKTPEGSLSKSDVKSGKAKYTVISYQVHCSVYDPERPDTKEWSAICYPNDGQRLKLADLILFAVSEGIRSGAVTGVPSKVYLVGHFTRADVPAFADFQTLTEMVSSVRSTFLSIKGYVALDIRFNGEEPIRLGVLLRDTMLLTPATSKSLAALGDLVGIPKVVLDPDDADRDQYLKENMDIVLRDDPELFERYAINDAVICVRYLQEIMQEYEALLGYREAPPTLTSIGVKLLVDDWETKGFDPLEMVGKERVMLRFFSKKKGHYVQKPMDVLLRECHWHNDFVTETYHGGRNEQYWFGPAFEDDWTDWDLAGAYPTAMALIGMPDWRNPVWSKRLSDFTLTTLGFVNVEFEFPESVRFPTLPIRTDNGLVFPRKGISDCSAPELALAHSLGAKLKVRHGVIFPTDPTNQVFADFIRDCVERRRSFDKGTLKNLFWKELSNSSYGKTAQGLRKKRVFDSRDREMKPLPESKLTNSFYASYITSFVRAALGEVMNALPPKVCVFSCTTDGFLSNATDDQIHAASQGPIADLYRASRELLVGVPEMLEVKHRVRKPLGWRTRGQATLLEGTTGKGDDDNIVLAKGGIYTSISMEDVRSRNAFITDLFLTRTPTKRIPVHGKTGIRDIVMFDADLVDVEWEKRLSMEYDWKRRPSAVWRDASTDHVAFATVPWETIDEFIEMRRHWEKFGIKTPRCIKTVGDFNDLAVFVLSQSSLSPKERRYLSRKEGPDLRRLRQSLCLARRHKKAGLQRKVHGRTDAVFADILISVGIPCKVTDVENARKPFLQKACPPTPNVLAALAALKAVFPSLEVEQFIANAGGIDLIGAVGLPNPFAPQTEVRASDAHPPAPGPSQTPEREPISVQEAA